VQQSSGAIRFVPCELVADPRTVFSQVQARRRVDGSYRRWSEAAWTDTLGKLVRWPVAVSGSSLPGSCVRSRASRGNQFGGGRRPNQFPLAERDLGKLAVSTVTNPAGLASDREIAASVSMSESKTSMIGCAACGTTNRVPEGKMSADPKCGRCGIALRDGQPAVLTAANFVALAERSDIPLLVDFWAPWCGPCREMGSAFSAATAQLEPALRLAKLNAEAERGLAQRFGIQSIPTLMILHKGREIARQSGAMPSSAIIDWARRECSRTSARIRSSD
jgi:thioredoxin 2